MDALRSYFEYLLTVPSDKSFDVSDHERMMIVGNCVGSVCDIFQTDSNVSKKSKMCPSIFKNPGYVATVIFLAIWTALTIYKTINFLN